MKVSLKGRLRFSHTDDYLDSRYIVGRIGLEKHSRILVAGSQTITGEAILRLLQHQGYVNVVDGSKDGADLTNADQVDAVFSDTSPEYVFLTAGKSGGIEANRKYPAELMLDNLLIVSNIIHTAHRFQAKKLLYLASSCIYPRECAQPMKEESLLTGPLEPTNEAYALAKIAGLKLCQAYYQQYGSRFLTAIPSNEFGPEEDFSLDDSHVIAALTRKMHEAKLSGAEAVEVWGTGAALREFIFVDDLAAACIFIMSRYDGPEPINAGSGSTVSIRQLADSIKAVVGYQGKLRFDSSKSDGMPMKMLDSTKLLDLGWTPTTPLETGLEYMYRSFLEQLQGSTP